MATKTRNRRQNDLVDAIENKRKASATSLLNDLMEVAPEAVQFKKRLLRDVGAPDYLRLQNANDILDRTLPKPTQQVSFQGQMAYSNMSERELQHLFFAKLQKLGYISKEQVEDADYEEVMNSNE